ncbi:hypothetical protein COCOBI_02-6030 [Coccomyxa sp. Obi]|nr:hypothetical protein COCOBI_02-6030 [Coccomyxa sp. Obi]
MNSLHPAASQGVAPTTQLHIAPPVSTKRQQEYINEDIVRLLNPDCNRPFASFEDAVDRLLPFHMLAAEETEKADFEEAKTLSSGGLLLSRHEAWQQVCLQKSMQYAEQLNTLGLKLKDIMEQRNKPGYPRPEEEIYLSKLSAEADKQVSAGIRAEAQRRAAEQLEAIRQRELEAERVLQEANARLKAEQAQADGNADSLPEAAAASSLPGQAAGQEQEAAVASPPLAVAPGKSELQPAATLKQEPEPEPEPEPGGWSGWQ